MKKLVSISILTIISAIMFTSCDKEEEERMLSPKEQILVSHTWEFRDIFFTLDIPDSVWFVKLMDANDAMEGHQLTFHKDNTYTDSFDTKVKGHWEMSSDGKFLKVKDDDAEANLELLNLDDMLLVFKMFNADLGTDVNMTYSKQLP